MHDSSVWEKRWQALEKTMERMSKRYGRLPNPTYKAVVECLKAFGASQFQFFNNGFQQGRLVPSMEYPAEYTLRTTLDQVGDDLSLIERAVDQRAHGSAAMKETLDKADRLAQEAINLAVEGGLLNGHKPTVITYFNKSAEVRMIPYAPVALVGVPFTAMAVAQDFLAIPHEVGHYVYRHTLGLAAELDALMPLQPAYQRPWMEEIFADVYGCLVAGPVMGLDFQDLFLDDSLEDFVGDDGDHPVEALRPDLYTSVLTELGFPVAAEALNQRWAERLVKRGSPSTFVPYGEFGEVALDDARAELEKAAGKVLQHLEKVHKVRQSDPAGYWSEELKNGAEVESLYRAFANRASSPPDVIVPQLRDLGDKVGIVEGNSEPTNVRYKGKTGTWIDWMKKPSNDNGPYGVSSSIWVPILTGGGWTTKGPEGGWPP